MWKNYPLSGGFFSIWWHSRKNPTLITYCEIIHTNFLGHVFRNIKWVNLPTLHRSFRRPFTWLPFIVPHIACWVLSVQFMASQHWQYLPNESRWLLGAHGELLSLLLFLTYFSWYVCYYLKVLPLILFYFFPQPFLSTSNLCICFSS